MTATQGTTKEDRWNLMIYLEYMGDHGLEVILECKAGRRRQASKSTFNADYIKETHHVLSNAEEIKAAISSPWQNSGRWYMEMTKDLQRIRIDTKTNEGKSMRLR